MATATPRPRPLASPSASDRPLARSRTSGLRRRVPALATVGVRRKAGRLLEGAVAPGAVAAARPAGSPRSLGVGPHKDSALATKTAEVVALAPSRRCRNAAY